MLKNLRTTSQARSFVVIAILFLFIPLSGHFAIVSGQEGGNCFSADRAMGSTKRNDHYNWAQEQNASRLEANLKSKIEFLYKCSSVSGEGFANLFADISSAIANSVQNTACFNNDRGATGADRTAHYDWAKTKTRQQVFQNLQWKTVAGFRCLDSSGQKSFFADLSVLIAQAGAGKQVGDSDPQNGRWRLTAIVPQGQPYPGSYTIEINLTERNGNLTGSGTWSNGQRSNFTGELRNNEIVLYRVDTNGFRGTFWGRGTANGRMEGTGRNDPSSPGGNSASYSWTAVRLQ